MYRVEVRQSIQHVRAGRAKLLMKKGNGCACCSGGEAGRGGICKLGGGEVMLRCCQSAVACGNDIDERGGN